MPKMTAFIARSFSSVDEARLRPTFEFLNSFRKFGFICQSAEAAEVESVSIKVRKMIDASDVLIGFFTKRHPIYKSAPRLQIAQWLKPVMPAAWSAPPWVLQESGYALARDKKLILLRESDVEIPGLQGDLEYVSFVPEKASEVFAKLSEMIHELMAEAAGIKVEVVVSEQKQVEPPASGESPLLPEQPTAPLEPDEPSIVPFFFDMLDGGAEKNLEKIESAFEKGKLFILSGKSDIDLLSWECIYHEERFKAGSPGALDTLRKLQEANPDRSEPLSRIADILLDAKDHEDAAKLYHRAALLEKKPARRIGLLIKAARVFDEAHQVDKANELAWEAYLGSANDPQRREASAALYDILKSKKEMPFAFAIAEAALHDNPQHSVRFQLGLDYHNADLNSLFLLHFKYLCDADHHNASAMHNLALALSECDLPISSVTKYKRAIDLGGTFSAANLAYKYLDAGMSDNARDILQPAMQVKDHEASLDRCFAEINERIQTEEEKEIELLESANDVRKFLFRVGIGLQTPPPEITGNWSLPFGNMNLKSINNNVSGRSEITETKEEGAWAFLGSMGEKTVRTKVYTLSGALTGSVCKFNLEIKSSNPLAALGGPNTREGLLVFDSTGTTGMYAEVKDNKIGDRSPVSRHS